MAAAEAQREEIPVSALNPRFLHTNSTSHTWPFSAVAELIDNAYDPDVNARQLWIEKATIKERICLIFTDNGQGMNKDKLYKMLSFGFSDKTILNGHAPVGLYGNGFKSGSMRLGKDAIVFTKQGETSSVGFLSQTYLQAVKAENVLVPIISYNQNKKLLTENMNLSLQAILSYSLFNSENELLKELEAIPGRKGTRIIIWNTRETKDGKPEFDFESDKYDIRIPDDILNEGTEKKKYKRQDRVDQYATESDYSLRAYCSILYLKPRMQIILRGRKVKTQLISKNLAQIEHDTYKPLFFKENIKITFGFNWRNKEHYGIMMYHRNRLIKAYEKVGCQLGANDLGMGVIGVIECNFLKPTHNKQDFDYSNEYRLTLKALGQKLNEYWNEKKNNNQCILLNHPLEDSQKRPDQVWVQCDSCLKWRKLSDDIDPDMLPEKWFCSMNQDPNHKSCSVPEEPEEGPEGYQKTYKKKGQKSRGKTTFQSVNVSAQPNLQKLIHSYGREARALQREQERLQLHLAGGKGSPETNKVTLTPQKMTKWVSVKVSPGSKSKSSIPSASPLSNLQIMEVKSLSCPQKSTDGQSSKRKLDYDNATPSSKNPKVNDEKPLSVSLNGDAASCINFEDDLILLEERSTPQPEENVDLSKVKKEYSENVDMSSFAVDQCGDNVLSQSIQTENMEISIKEERTASINQSFSDSTSEERVQIQRPHNVLDQCSSDTKESEVKNNEPLQIQKDLLKSMMQQRDNLKAKNKLLEKQLEGLSKKLLKIPGSHVKMEQFHQWTQCDFIIGDKSEHLKDFSNFSNKEKTVQYELVLKEVEKLKQQFQELESHKQKCSACQMNKDDKQAQDLDEVLQCLDNCKSERDKLKDKADQLQNEKVALQLNCENLSEEVERLKQEVTEAQQNISNAASMKLLSLRVAVGHLLLNLIPDLDLDLAQINYENTVVDEILDQVLSGNTL